MLSVYFPQLNNGKFYEIFVAALDFHSNRRRSGGSRETDSKESKKIHPNPSDSQNFIPNGENQPHPKITN